MIQPINDHVFIRDIEQERQTASGILLAPSNERVSSIGMVEAVSENDAGLKIGDKVIYSRFSAEDVILGKDDKGLRSVHIDQIHAILTEK